MLHLINYKNIFSFLLGCTTFFVLSRLFPYHGSFDLLPNEYIPNKPIDNHNEFDKYVEKHIHEKNQILKWNDRGSHSHRNEDIVANYLSKKIKIFCWIATMKKDHDTKAYHVKATWAKRCNRFLFFSNTNDVKLPAINANVTDGRGFLWAKTKSAFRYLYKHHLNDYDFFLKADDDSFVILENLRYLVKDMSPNKPSYMGRRFKQFVKQGYMSGGGTYLLSREALKQFVEKALDKAKKCPSGNGGAEDVNTGACLEAIGVPVVDSLDNQGRETFHPLSPMTMLIEDHMKSVPWMYSYNYHKLKFGTACCSDASVSFHYISPHDMYMLEYMIYHLHPFGIVPNFQELRPLLMNASSSFIQSQ